jgi:hypothetical protein
MSTLQEIWELIYLMHGTWFLIYSLVTHYEVAGHY